MAQLTISNKVISNVNNENLASVLNALIDAELSKDVDKIDTDFVNECVDALLQLENEENGFVALVPLMSSDKFLKSITKDNTNAFKNLNIFVRVALIAAIVAGGTLTANAAVQAVTGVNMLQELGTRVQTTLGNLGLIDFEGIEYIEGVDDDDDEITTTTASTTKKAESTTQLTTSVRVEPTTQYEGIDYIEGIDDDDDDVTTTTAPTTAEPTTQFEGIEYIEGVDDDDDDVTTTTAQTTTTTLPATTKPVVTSPKPAQPSKPNQRSLNSISADTTNFKADYIYGEEFDPSGIRLYANYSDDTSEEIALGDCYCTKLDFGTVTADYTCKIMYKGCMLELAVTLRPDEETRGSQICSNNEFDYLLTKDGAYITAYKGDRTTIAMNSVDGNKVVAVCANMLSGANVEKVSSKTATKIFENAFKSCRKLEKATFPKATYIGDSAFNDCESLSDIQLSSEIEYLGKYAFRKTAIESLELTGTVTEVPIGLCDTCEKLAYIKLSNTTTSIGANAFSDCKALELAEGMANVKEIGAYAFYNDEKLNFDTFPQSLSSVGECGFFMCQSLEIEDIPQTLTSIGKSSFAYCSKLTALTIPQGIEVIPYESFRGTGAKTVVIPEGVQVIEDYALRAVKATKITLPSSLKKIGSEAIYSPLLRQLYFGRNVQTIADDAFYKGKSVTFYVYEGTEPMKWAIDNNIKYVLQ